MSQTINIKSAIIGLSPATARYQVKAADTNVAAGATGVATLPYAGTWFALAVLSFKALGTAVTIQPRFADNAALTTNPVGGAVVSNASFNVAPNDIILEAITHLSTSAYFGIWDFGTLTGTYTYDSSYEFYPLL